MIFDKRLGSGKGKLSETKITLRKVGVKEWEENIYAAGLKMLQGNAYVQRKIFL